MSFQAALNQAIDAQHDYLQQFESYLDSRPSLRHEINGAADLMPSSIPLSLSTLSGERPVGYSVESSDTNLSPYQGAGQGSWFHQHRDAKDPSYLQEGPYQAFEVHPDGQMCAFYLNKPRQTRYIGFCYRPEQDELVTGLAMEVHYTPDHVSGKFSPSSSLLLQGKLVADQDFTLSFSLSLDSRHRPPTNVLSADSSGRGLTIQGNAYHGWLVSALPPTTAFDPDHYYPSSTRRSHRAVFAFDRQAWRAVVSAYAARTGFTLPDNLAWKLRSFGVYIKGDSVAENVGVAVTRLRLLQLRPAYQPEF